MQNCCSNPLLDLKFNKRKNVTSLLHVEDESRTKHNSHGKNHLQALPVWLIISFLVIVDITKYCFVGLICVDEMVGCVFGGGKAS